MRAMTDMELDDDAILDCVVPMDCERPKYPYGLRICLTEKEMEKLDIDPSEAFVGGMVHLHALAKITSVSCNETEGGDGETNENARVEMQICYLAIESEDEENEQYDRKSGASALYGA